MQEEEERPEGSVPAAPEVAQPQALLAGGQQPQLTALQFQQ